MIKLLAKILSYISAYFALRIHYCALSTLNKLTIYKVFIKQCQDLHFRDTIILSALLHKINPKIQTEPILKIKG